LCIAGGNVKWCNFYREYSTSIPQKLKVLPYDSVIPLLVIYPKELKAGTQTHICIPMFIAALFRIATRCKKPKCPSRDECIKERLGRWWSRRT